MQRRATGRVSHNHERKDASFPAPPTGQGSADYAAGFARIKERIRTQRLRVVLAANEALVLLYWDVGRMILEYQGKEG